jgi:hypothetical protein
MSKQQTTITPIVWVHYWPGTITAYLNGHCFFCSQLPDRNARFEFWKDYMEQEGFRVRVIHKS